MSDTLGEVFVIDDEKFDRMACRRALVKSGIVGDMRLFGGAEEAIAHLETAETRPDVIFLDINMPRMTGFDFLEAADGLLRRAGRTPRVAMLTTSINPVDRERAENFDLIRHFLEKPLTVEKVRAAAAG